MKLKNKVAIVTGSGRGIGRAIAIEFAKEGAKVVTNAVHKKNCDKVADEIKKMGGEALSVPADVSKPNDVKKLIRKTIQKYKRIDILVNNAGIAKQGSIIDISTKEWDKVLDVDLRGTFSCSKEALKYMIKQKNGKIINMTSIAGRVGFSNLAHYCAAKGGIIELTREMAVELAPYKINVNAIGPGIIETDMTAGILSDPKQKKFMLSNIPLGRIGKPEDIAKACLFLASSDSDYITGESIFVDGGWLVR